MATDKLSLINDELALLNENPVAVEDDGSPEWNTCSSAFATAVAENVQAHSWDFDTKIGPLNRVGDSPDDLYDDAFAKPIGCLHLIWLRLNDQTVDYKIINNQICCTANGGTLTAKYVVDQGVQNWPPLFARIIRYWVRAAIYRGLQEDPATADREEAKAAAALRAAQTRVDQEQPKRAPFNSRAIGARRVRRPFVNSPAGWSGTDVPN